MDNGALKNICMRFSMIEGELMFGGIDFEYDRLMTVMGAGHPADMMDSILSPVFWPVQAGEEVPVDDVVRLYKEMNEFKNSFKIKEIEEPLTELKALLEEDGVEIYPSKIKFDALKEEYVGKTIDMDKLKKAGDVWNLEIRDGILEGHYYWNGERHRYVDQFHIAVDENMHILDIMPLRTCTADGRGWEPCRYLLIHNGAFDQILKKATS